jgi:steroid 5-alpha reductase family enzyme
MRKAYLNIVFAYLIAGTAAALFGNIVGGWHPILVVAVADLAGTMVIFGFSVYLDNSSVYDAYWSLAPILIAFYWLIFSRPSVLDNQLRQVVVMALVLIWGFRLTLNWAVRWRGIAHEDWRYVDFREKHGKAYWVISFFGIHLMPTVLVFLGCLPLVPSLVEPATTFNALDIIAVLVTGAAIWIEFRADLDVTRFRNSERDEEELLQSGLWSLSRHPNYFGEILFWWGLFAFAYAANPGYWWTIIGPLSITLLFIFISIPMIEKRLLTRKPEYAAYMKTTSMLVPWRMPKR